MVGVVLILACPASLIGGEAATPTERR